MAAQVSTPNVVYRQIHRGATRKALANLSAADAESLQAYRAYRNPNGGNGGLHATMLDAAVQFGSPEVVKALLAFWGPTTSLEDRGLWNRWAQRVRNPSSAEEKPFPVALDPQDRAVFEALVRSGVGRTSLSGVCWGAAHIAVSRLSAAPTDALHCLKFLKENGFDTDQPDEINESPLAVACWETSPDVVRWLIEAGASLARTTKGGRTILSFVWRSVDGPRNQAKMDRQADLRDTLGALRDAGYPVVTEMRDLLQNAPEKVEREWGEAWGVRWRTLLSSILLEGTLEDDLKPQEKKTRSSRIRM